MNLNKILLIIIAILVTIILIRGCGNDTQIITKLSDNSIYTERIKKDSIKAIRLATDIGILKRDAVKNDSLQKYAKVKYITLKQRYAHTICDTIIMACDSVIKTDSIAIKQRDNVIIKQDTLITTLESESLAKSFIIQNKNKDIILFKKEVKKQKIAKIVVIAVAVLGVIGSVFLLK